MKVKTLLFIAAFTPLAAFASIPTQCPTPAQIRSMALNNQLHTEYNLKSVALGEWYLTDSADSSGEAPQEIAELTNHSDWVASAEYGGAGLNGAAIKCDYYSPTVPTTTANDGHIIVSTYFNRKFSSKN